MEELVSFRTVTARSEVLQAAGCSFSHVSYVPLYCKPCFGLLSLTAQRYICLQGELVIQKPLSGCGSLC